MPVPRAKARQVQRLNKVRGVRGQFEQPHAGTLRFLYRLQRDVGLVAVKNEKDWLLDAVNDSALVVDKLNEMVHP